MKKIVPVALILTLILNPAMTKTAYAEGVKAAAASFLLPTTGQAMNGQIGSTKTKIMGGLEVGLVTTLFILGNAVGGPVVWAAAGPLLANHTWSAADAYVSAKQNNQLQATDAMTDAQRTLDWSREQRFDREQAYRSGVRERIQMAGEQKY